MFTAVSTGSADISVGSPRPVSPIRDLLRPSSDVVIITGAGLSAGCGLPTGKALAEWLRRQPFADGVDFSGLGELIDHPGYVAGEIADGDDREERRSTMREAVDNYISTLQDRAPSELTPALRAVGRAPSGLVLTLNYDTLVERAAELEGRPCKPFGPNDIRQLVSDGIYPRDGGLYVVHLHGILGSPRDFVLDHQSYAARAMSPEVLALFAGVVANRRSFCAIGTEFAEDYLTTVALSLRPGAPRHVVVGEMSLTERMEKGQTFLQPRRHGWQVCQFANGDYRVLDPFCEWLVAEPDSRVGELTLLPSGCDPDPVSRYTARRLIPQDDPAIERGPFDDLSVPETALLAEQRSLIIGVPGGGKSRLLAALADVEKGPTAVIPVHAIRAYVGEPERLLRAWLADARVAGPHVLSASEVVAGGVRAWIQLDGLDEADLPIRSEISEAITRVADAYPQHRFSVTMRPNPAEATFGDEWRRFELVCDQRWQSEYLVANDVDADAFWGDMAQGGSGLREVLEVAFFLQAAVTLWKEGGEVDNARQIVLDLLDRATAADEQLHPIGPRARVWLRRVALAQQLGDSLAIDEADLVALAETEELGDPVRVADLLARRSLLSVADETWTFTHRLFGEALVAEQLLEEDPGTWIECVAPAREGRSRVLDRWASPLGMVLDASAEWRAAISERDPRFAARMTPLGAAREEREAAGLFLWRRATVTDTWIDPMATPRSGLGATDGSVVARFMRSGQAPTLEAEVRQGLSSESRFARGNAIDVLAAVPIDDIADRLRAILAEDDDYVVRRSAASAAGRLTIGGLLPLIVDRAKSPEDESEAHDMASVAMRLTPASERLRVALELSDHGNSYMKYYRLPAEHPADDRLRWLEAQNKVDDHGGMSVEREIRSILEDGTEALSADAAERIGYLTVTQRIRDRAIVEYTVELEAAVRGVVRAFNEHPGFAYARGSWLLRAIGPQLLDQAEAPRDLLERVKAWGPPTVDPESAPRASEVEAHEQAQKATVLRTVLRLPLHERFAPLAGLANIDQGELGDLEDPLKQELAATLEHWWGTNDLSEAVTLVGRQATIKSWATIVLTLGPPLRLELSQSRWVEVATCGFVFDAQIRWLRAQLTDDRVAAALAKLCPARALVDLLQIAKQSDVGPITAAIAERSFVDFDEGDIRDVCEVFRELGAVDNMTMLLHADDRWRGPLDPILASHGVLDAQKRELERMAAALDADNLGEYDWNNNWLREIRSPLLTSDVSRALYAAARMHRSDDRGSLVPVLVSTLGKIGTEAALEAIEQFIVARPYPGAQFLTQDLDGLIQELLEPLSQAEARRIAEARGLPFS